MKHRWLRFGLCALLTPIVVLLVAAALEPLPPALSSAPQTSVRVLDRNGRVIANVRAGDGVLAQRVRLDELAPELVPALVAAEDARFWWHPGIDPIAIARALGQAALERRIVSGASTLTQQLARSVEPRPRTLRGKFRELALALRIEASLDKRQILEQYLNQIEFGPNLRGVEAASRHYFDKPASRLGLAEAATLAAIPRGPSLYDPARGSERVQRRRDRILERMRRAELASDDAIDRALSEPVSLQRGFVEQGARHLVRALASGALAPELARGAQEITASIDLELQHEVERLAKSSIESAARYDASSAAVLVVDNASGAVRAYVGSPDFFSQQAQGQNDGTRALRQPGSALKPFVYATAMAELGMTAATLLPDVELHLPTPQGDYSPNNYDRRFHGPVRLREALASSLNVPAVYTASRVGPERVLQTLRRVGFSSLQADAAHYGAAIALGNGEVRLSELASAYSTLARGGLALPLRFVESAVLPDGRTRLPEQRAAERVLDARIASVLTDILADDGARVAAFGHDSVLELPFPVAVKTGTSKGFRDNWTVGYTRELTVAVWVGNFDGRPMRDSSGVTGAGPLFRHVLLAAMRGQQPAPLVDRSGLVEREVCALSGWQPTSNCPHRTRELFASGELPSGRCELHVLVAIDPLNGLRAGPGCRDAELRPFESHAPMFVAWAASAGRPLPPLGESARCPVGSVAGRRGAPSVTFPFDGARFVIDPSLPREQQQLALRATGVDGQVRFVMDGRLLASVSVPFVHHWPLSPGDHELVVESAAGRRSSPVRFLVR
jgi:penicillin-binding protein 1C